MVAIFLNTSATIKTVTTMPTTNVITWHHIKCYTDEIACSLRGTVFTTVLCSNLCRLRNRNMKRQGHLTDSWVSAVWAIHGWLYLSDLNCHHSAGAVLLITKTWSGSLRKQLWFMITIPSLEATWKREQGSWLAGSCGGRRIEPIELGREQKATEWKTLIFGCWDGLSRDTYN